MIPQRIVDFGYWQKAGGLKTVSNLVRIRTRFRIIRGQMDPLLGGRHVYPIYNISLETNMFTDYDAVQIITQ